ncbi:hypothetical protein GGS23DRAFT_590364 [Durotheca rogersii]|uniref:uncharacterized protein n=1 Tax=Durotheca rogersii TaxID=419775 RepID=UPI00221E6C5C|nr:uncharacterized protein GGS23DRAFT_590364 [Durotheca rogersii]KAI5855007.1 hypothetical protein GGS23DRAFT_590364 [Durotheca rogersii]
MEDVAEEAERAIANWEQIKGYKATPEQREKIISKKIRLRSMEWLEGIKNELQGKETVPIAWFNRLVAENERVICFVAKAMGRQAKREEAIKADLEARNQQFLNEMEEKFKSEIRELEDPTSGHDGEERKAIKAELHQAREKNTHLQNDLDGCRANHTRLRDELERLESEVRAADEAARISSETEELYKKQAAEAEAREEELRVAMDTEEKKLVEKLTLFKQKLEQLQRSEDESSALLEEVGALKRENARLTDQLAEQSRSLNGATSDLRSELDALKQENRRLRDQVTGKARGDRGKPEAGDKKRGDDGTLRGRASRE